MNGTFNLVKDWGIAAALLAGAVTWGVTTNRLANAEEQIKEAEQKVEVLQKDIETIKQSMVRIETNQVRNREDQAKTDAKIDKILEELSERP